MIPPPLPSQPLVIVGVADFVVRADVGDIALELERAETPRPEIAIAYAPGPLTVMADAGMDLELVLVEDGRLEERHLRVLEDARWTVRVPGCPRRIRNGCEVVPLPFFTVTVGEIVIGQARSSRDSPGRWRSALPMAVVQPAARPFWSAGTSDSELKVTPGGVERQAGAVEVVASSERARPDRWRWEWRRHSRR